MSSAREWFYGPLGFGSTRGSFPTSSTVVKTEVAMARTAKGLCPECSRHVNEDGKCPVCDRVEDPGPMAKYAHAKCPGPAGIWPCALPFGHGDDHVPAELGGEA